MCTYFLWKRGKQQYSFHTTILFPYCTGLTGRGKASLVFQHFNPGTTKRHYQKCISSLFVCLFVWVHVWPHTSPLCMMGTVRWLLTPAASKPVIHSHLNQTEGSSSFQLVWWKEAACGSKRTLLLPSLREKDQLSLPSYASPSDKRESSVSGGSEYPHTCKN